MLLNSKRVVIKIGSSLIADNNLFLKEKWLISLAEDIAFLQKSGIEIIIVSSGAVALGKQSLGIVKRKLKLEEKQAAAACGQIELLKAYKEQFSRHSISIAQILLTIDDSENRRRYLNARNTFDTLLERNIIPIVNENDSVATLEIRFGDNDRLAARVSEMVMADLLIIFSDIDGLYDDNPITNKNAKFIPIIENITNEIRDMAGDPTSNVGTGGMVTKIMAAEIATSAGTNVIIAKGVHHHPIKKLLEKDAKYSLFKAKSNPISARKSWIANSLNISGEIIVDDGAKQAIIKGKSLLPVGIKQVAGDFSRGDILKISDLSGNKIAIGISAYSSEDARRIIGKKSSDIADLLGYLGRDEIIHRNDLVVI